MVARVIIAAAGRAALWRREQDPREEEIQGAARYYR